MPGVPEVPGILVAGWPLTVALLAAAVAFRNSADVGLPRTRRLGWQLLGLALLVHLAATAGDLVLEHMPVTAVERLDGALAAAAGVFFLFGGAGVAALAASGPDSGPRVRFWLDASVIVLSFGALLWVFVLAPSLAEVDGSDARRLVLAAGLVLLASLLLAGHPHRPRLAADVWLFIGSLLLLASELAVAGVGGTAPAGLPVVVQGAAFALFAVAAHFDFIAGRRAPRPAAAHRGRADMAVVPLAGLLLAMIALVLDRMPAWREPGFLLLFAVFAAGLLLLGRQRLATRDVARSEAEAARSAAEARFTSLVRESSDAIAITAGDGRLVYVTPSAQRVFGVPPEALLGRRMTELVALEDRVRLQEVFATALAPDGASETVELRVVRGKDDQRVIEMVATNLLREPSVAGCVLNIRDVTERKRLEEQLRRLAFHDPLTLLANRALFRDRVQHALAVSRRRGNRVAAIFVDLDNFKKINDSMGHGEGDRVLRATAQRLTRCTRTGDTVARLGGDEFAVLTEDAADPKGVIEVAERIVETLREPFPGSSLCVAASVGVAFAAEGDSVEDLLRNADVAMYHAKEQGKNRFRVFEPQMQQAARDRSRIEADLTRAFHRNELRLLYQPIVDLASGYLLGVEALVRWQHPERGLITPAEFMEVAEETGQVVGLGRRVLYEACREVRDWRERMPLGEELRVWVNVSARQLQSGSLLSEITGALEQSGLDPSGLVVEMTERVVMQNTEETLARLCELKGLGVRIAIDDFGTGYSSLTYLHRFPIDILKIDRSFVQGLGDERDGTELARAIIMLGGTLGLEVVAEGIEYEHQLRELVELGCVAGQGYYYSRPALLREIEYSHQARLRRTFVRGLATPVGASPIGRLQPRSAAEPLAGGFGAAGSGP